MSQESKSALSHFLTSCALIPGMRSRSDTIATDVHPNLVFSTLKPDWDCLIGRKVDEMHMVPRVFGKKRTDFQHVIVPDNVRITSGQWLFKVTSSTAFVCGFVDGVYPLDSTCSLGYPSRHKWVWSTETCSGVTDKWVPLNGISEDDAEETTVHCRLDCEKREIAFRVNDGAVWVIVATDVIAESCFIPVMALREDEKFTFSLLYTGENEAAVTPITLLEVEKIQRNSPRAASPETDRIGMLTRSILSSVIELWPSERSLFSYFPLTICTETTSVLEEVISLLKKRPDLVAPFLKQLWGMRKSEYWLLYRDLLLLELLKEFTSRSEGSTEWAETCVESISSEWCRVSLDSLRCSQKGVSVSAQRSPRLPPLCPFFS